MSSCWHPVYIGVGVGSPGLPRDINDRAGQAVKQAIDDPAFQEQAKKIAVPVHYLDPDKTRQLAETC